MKNCVMITLVGLMTISQPVFAQDEIEKCPFEGLSLPAKALSSGYNVVRRIGGGNGEVAPLDVSAPPASMQAIASAERIHAPAARAYLERIRDKLLATVPAEQQLSHKPDIFVTGSSSYAAYAFFDERILLSHEILRVAKSDDEVAFIIAHELAHILYDDTSDLETLEKSMKRVELMRKGLDFATSVAALAIDDGSAKSSANAQKVGNHNSKVNYYADLFHDVSEKALVPTWTKSQEDDADKEAIRMMIKAGYSPDGAFDAVDHIEMGVRKSCRGLVAINDTVDDYMKTVKTTDWIAVANASNADRLKTVFKPFTSVAAKRFRAALMSHALPRTHRDAKGRKKQITKFLNDEENADLQEASYDLVQSAAGISAYRNKGAYKSVKASLEAAVEVRAALLANDTQRASALINKVDMTSSYGRLLKRQVRIAQGRYNDAAQNLSLALGLAPPNAEPPALRVYELYAEHLLAKKQYKTAMSVTARGSRKFNDSIHFLPEKIFNLVQAGNRQAAAELVLECETSDRKALWDVCRAAEFGVRSDFRSAAEEILKQAQCEDNECKKQGIGSRLQKTISELRD